MLRTIGLLLAALLLGASAQEQQQQDQGWRYEERKGDPGEWQTHRGGEGRRSGGGGRPHDLSEFPTVARQDTPRRGDEGLAPLDVRPALRVVYDIAVNFSTKSWGQHHEQHLYEQQQWQQRQKQQQQKQQQQQDAGEGRMYGNDSGIQLYKINIMNDGPGDGAYVCACMAVSM